jgi:hypothetical protein
MNVIGPKLSPLRLDKVLRDFAAAGFASRWLAMSIVRHDVES